MAKGINGSNSKSTQNIYDFMTYLTNKPRIMIAIYDFVDWIKFVEFVCNVILL